MRLAKLVVAIPVLVVLVPGLFVTPAVAAGEVDANPVRVWKIVANWAIGIDPVDQGCFMATSYTDGTFFRIGINTLHGPPSGYALLGNDHWQFLKPGSYYNIQLILGTNSDGETDDYAWKAEGFLMGGRTPTLTFSFLVSGVFKKLAENDGINFYSGDTMIAAITLAGAPQAINELMRCQESLTRSIPLN